MKIDVRRIVIDHFRTLYNARSGRLSLFDFTLFYLLPLSIAGFAFCRGFTIENDAYNVSITFFGIFIALLLNIQVALFSILQRKWTAPSDRRLADAQDEALAERTALLKELNSNISYLVLICCISLAAALLFYVEDWKTGIPPAMMVFVFSHFLLTLVMVVKRSHALFQREYVTKHAD